MKNKYIIATMLAAIMVLSVVAFVPGALAGKPQNVMEWSNGFPSGEHFNLNIHGKKDNYVCNNSEEAEPFGNSIFVPLNGLSEINFFSNKKSPAEDITVLDPCAAPLETTSGDSDPALIQIPANEVFQVYARILGTPTIKKDDPIEPSVVFYPKLPIACDDIGETVYNDTDSSGNVTLGDTRLANAAKFGYADGSIVQSGDLDDAQNIVNFTTNEKHGDSVSNGIFDVGEPIYNDAENSGNVTAGDTRLANAPSGYDEGSVVAPGDTDMGADLVAFIDGVEMHEETGGTPNMFDYGQVGFGDLTSCVIDQSLIGIGVVDGTNGYGLDGQELYRFESPEGKGKGKGKSRAVNITDMFYWTGFACDPSVDTAEPWGVIDANDLPDDYLGTVEEYLLELEGQGLCIEHDNKWIFDIADLVLYGWDYVNSGAKLVQVRFYPQSTTEFS